DAARSVAARTGLRDGERTLRHPHLPGAAAGRAGGRLRAGACAATLAALARRHAGDADLGLEAVRRLLERDLEVVAQVGAAVHGAAPAARASAAEDLAENVAEDVAEAAHARGSGGAHAGLRIDAGAARCSLAPAARVQPVVLSFTSVNSASTTLLSSFLPASPGAAPCACWPPVCAWVSAYIFSPSFCAACASACALASIAALSSDLSEPSASFSADSILSFSP